MTRKEQAKELLSSTRFVRSEVAIDLILAFADETRRECAENARNAIFDFGIGDKEHIYSPIIRKDLAAQLVERAIIGKE